jgi:hypothetical protein
MLKEGIYEEIINCKIKKELASFDLDGYKIGKEPIDVEEVRKILVSYISFVTRKALKYVRDNKSDDQEALLGQIRTCNEIISVLSKRLDQEEFESLKIVEEAEVLTSIYSRFNSIRSIKNDKVVRPITPISQSSLFTGSHYEPNMLGEVKREIISSDAIDLLVSFIKWSGLRCFVRK